VTHFPDPDDPFGGVPFGSYPAGHRPPPYGGPPVIPAPTPQPPRRRKRGIVILTTVAAVVVIAVAALVIWAVISSSPSAPSAGATSTETTPTSTTPTLSVPRPVGQSQLPDFLLSLDDIRRLANAPNDYKLVGSTALNGSAGLTVTPAPCVTALFGGGTEVFDPSRVIATVSRQLNLVGLSAVAG
jgi:hypothetical protein